MPDLDVHPLSVGDSRDNEAVLVCSEIPQPVSSAMTSQALEEFLHPGPPQLFVTDVDGTLLDPNHSLSERTASALRNLVRKGVCLRTPSSAP